MTAHAAFSGRQLTSCWSRVSSDGTELNESAVQSESLKLLQTSKEITLMKEQEIEQELKNKGLNAPRVTSALIDSVISNTSYHLFPGTQLTVCCMLLRNGFTVVGQSACASPDNFVEVMGERLAYDDARSKICMLEGYLLKQRLHDGDVLAYQD